MGVAESFVFKWSKEAMFIASEEMEIISVNAALEKVTGRVAETIMGVRSSFFEPSPESGIDNTEFVWDIVASCGSWRGSVVIRRDDGGVSVGWMSITPLRDEGRMYGYLGVINGISEIDIGHGFRDSLTGLGNKNLLMTKISESKDDYDREGNKFAIVSIDLNDVTGASSEIGEEHSDLLIRTFGKRISQVIRKTDIAFRLDDDSFAAILRGTTEIGSIAAAMKIESNIKDPVDLDNGIVVNVDVNVGVSTYPDDGHDADDLFKAADSSIEKKKRVKTNREEFHLDRFAASGDVIRAE